jgi:hypothetical protein
MRLIGEVLKVVKATYDEPRLARLNAMEAAASGGPNLEAALATIDEAAQRAMEWHHGEVYVGFHELMPRPPQPSQPAPPPQRKPETALVPVTTPATAFKPAHEARPDTDGRVIQFEWLVSEPNDSPPVPVPPDLADGDPRARGRAGVRCLPSGGLHVERGLVVEHRPAAVHKVPACAGGYHEKEHPRAAREVASGAAF